MRVQWNAFVEIVPLWLAPNMVTLLGFFFILGNVALMRYLFLILWAQYDLSEPLFPGLVLTAKGSLLVVLQFRLWHVDVSQRLTI